MPIPQRIIKYLDSAKIKYETISHKIVYTAYDKSATLRVPEKTVGKTLVTKADKEYFFVLLPANKKLDKNAFKKTVNDWKKKTGQKPIKTIDFSNEAWMKKTLKGIKLGAVPPFGSIWKLATFADKSILDNPKIIINSGDYNFSIKISSGNLKKLIPDLIVGSFSRAKKYG